MTIRVALNHKTHYQYDRRTDLGPQEIRLRPAAHCRTPIESYSLDVRPDNHFLNWQQDPHGNYVARCVFNEQVSEFTVQVDLVATMTVINPFDFFLEPEAENYPFSYAAELFVDLRPYLELSQAGPKMLAFLGALDYRSRRTIDFLVDLNQELEQHIEYTIRLEPGVQTPEETLTLQSGSCRDTGWLLVQLLRQLGFAARFVSGYLIQLKADQESLDGPSGPDSDFVDLHAWAEVYLPGAGWIGLDPTSGLFAGEGHIPLACTPSPKTAAPITGTLGLCNAEFGHAMSVTRVHEDPRVTLPYTESQWQAVDQLGKRIDQQLDASDVRLSMGGEPTFVSIDDMEGEEWRISADGPNKQRLAYDLLLRLQRRFSTGGVLHFGQGKWYPGEPLPRWSMAVYWRKDGEPLWRHPKAFADLDTDYGHGAAEAEQFAKKLATRLGIDDRYAIPCYEDSLYYMWRERRLPKNVDLRDSKLDDPLERERIARILDKGLTSAVGMALPLRHVWWESSPRWISGPWIVRSDEMFLLPGNSPMGYRLPLQSLIYEELPEGHSDFFSQDPFEPSAELVTNEQLRDTLALRTGVLSTVSEDSIQYDRSRVLQFHHATTDHGTTAESPESHWLSELASSTGGVPSKNGDLAQLVRTALCVEPRDGKLHLFLPPTDRIESFIDLISAIEETAVETNCPIIIEGYPPPYSSHIETIKVTPDPGVIEVNVQPAVNWSELKKITTGVYEESRQSRLGTEKFDLDGVHTGTGGGNHIVLGGPTPDDSPFLRRPDLLRSFITYWHNHPSLSYLFSGRFIGPTSQAPRVDESRVDALYELKIACEQIHAGESCAPWLVDRIFRNLLIDGSGNTHRAEFCIDKLFSPDSSTGRLGLVEFRGFEMPPHSRMSLTQQLLIRGLVARFWQTPYEANLVTWKTILHDRFMLPHFVWEDFSDVIDDLQRQGFEFDLDWFAPHYEFRFPTLGEFVQRSIHVELRQAIEPWYVLGEESAGGGTSRFVDSSVERVQIKVRGMTDTRHRITCNGRSIPLHPTGIEGEYIAGLRYRAWQPPSCLHPTLPVDAPLVFDLIDTWNGRSIGGCQYHVSNPTGLNPSVFPVNSFEAESRRAARFLNIGHTGGPVLTSDHECSSEFPLTLDLRRGRHKQ